MSSVVRGLWSVSIDSHVRTLLRKYYTVLSVVRVNWFPCAVHLLLVIYVFAEQWWLFTFQRTERRQWGGVWGGSPPFTVYWCQYIVAFTDVFLLTQYLLCKYCTVLTSVDSNERKYCAVLTSVDSTDILCVSRILYSTLQSYIMSLLRKYCTVHYLFCKFCTVHYSGALLST